MKIIMRDQENISKVYSKLFHESSSDKRGFATSIPLQAAIIECENVNIHTIESASALELLIIQIANYFKKITRIELYYLSGRAPELLDKDIEKLRAEGYLEYVFPFDKKILIENLNELEVSIGCELIIQEELNRLKSRTELKQYYITQLGKQLYDTGKKNSTEEGDISFIFLHDKNGWYSTAYDLDKYPYWRYKLVSESDYAFWESFLKKYENQLSENKKFEELTQSSKINLFEPTIAYLWILSPSMRSFLQMKDKIIEVQLNNNYLVPFDEYDFQVKILDKNIPLNLISDQIEGIKLLGITYSLNLQSEHDVADTIKKFDYNINTHWCSDIIIEEEEILGICRIFYYPKSKEAVNSLIFHMIKAKNPDGNLKPKKQWLKDITRYSQSLRKLIDIESSSNDIIQVIASSDNLIIAEELVKNDVIKKYKDDIQEFEIVERLNQIFVYCILSEKRFREEYYKRKTDENFEETQITAIKSDFSQKYTIYINTPEHTDYFGALLARKARNHIFRRSELNKLVIDSNRQLPVNFQVTSPPLLDEVIKSIRVSLKDEILVAEEQIEKDISNSPLAAIISDFSIVEKNGSLCAYCCLKAGTIESIIESYSNNSSYLELIANPSLFLKTPEGISYQVIIITDQEKDINQIVMLRLAKENEGRLTNILKLKSRIKQLRNTFITESSIKLTIITEKEILDIITKTRNLTKILLEEEEIESDLNYLFNGKSSISDLEYDYSSSKKLVASFGIRKSGLLNLKTDALDLILGHNQNRKIDIQDGILEYKIIFFPLDRETMNLIIFKRIKFWLENSNKFWKGKEIEKRILKYAKTISQDKKCKISINEETESFIFEKIRAEKIKILEDVVIHHFQNIVKLDNITLSSDDNIIIATINLSELQLLKRVKSEIVQESDFLIKDEIDNKEFSYKVKLIPTDYVTLKELLVEKLLKKFIETYPSKSIIKNEIVRLLEDYEVFEFQIDHSSLLQDIIEDLISRGIETAENYLIRREIDRLKLNEDKIEVTDSDNVVILTINIDENNLVQLSTNPDVSTLFSEIEEKGKIRSSFYDVPYTIILKPIDSKTALKWVLMLTGLSIKGKLRNKQEVLEIYEKCLKKITNVSKVELISSENIFDLLKKFLGNDLIIKEDLIQQAILEALDNYPDIDITLEEVKILVSKKRVYEFKKKCEKIMISPIIPLNIEKVGKTNAIICPLDKDAFIKVLAIMLYQQQEKRVEDLSTTANTYFDVLLKQSYFDEKTKMKLVNQKLKLLPKILKEVLKQR